MILHRLCTQPKAHETRSPQVRPELVTSTRYEGHLRRGFAALQCGDASASPAVHLSDFGGSGLRTDYGGGIASIKNQLSIGEAEASPHWGEAVPLLSGDNQIGFMGCDLGYRATDCATWSTRPDVSNWART